MKIRIEVDDAISDEEVIIRCREISSTIQTLQQTLLQSLQKVKLVFYKNNVEYFIKKFDINAYNEMNYYEYIKNTLSEIDGVDGIFASSDLIAAQVIQVCYELNIKIPKDIKLVGFDDVEISQLTTPTITTIQQPIKEMAKLAIHLIDAKYTNTEILEQTILPVDLVVRRSTSVE